MTRPKIPVIPSYSSGERRRRLHLGAGVLFVAVGVLALGWAVFVLLFRPQDDFPLFGFAMAALYLLFGGNYIVPWLAAAGGRWPKPELADGEQQLWGVRASKLQGKHSLYPGGLSLTSERLVFVQAPGRGPESGERTQWPIDGIDSVDLNFAPVFAVRGESSRVLRVTFADGSEARFRMLDAPSAQRELTLLLEARSVPAVQ